MAASFVTINIHMDGCFRASVAKLHTATEKKRAKELIIIIIREGLCMKEKES